MRRTITTVLSAIAMVALGVVGAVAVGGSGTVDPPPKIAFLANGRVPADAVAAGSIAGQLGAPVFTTSADTLEDAARLGLTTYDPDLIIVLGGPVAIADAVVADLASATGLAIVPSSSTNPPDEGIVRAAGETRFDTAAVVADLLAAYAPAYLPVDATARGAVDADLLDGLDSTDFAAADQVCGAGDVVVGVDDQGDLLCTDDILTAVTPPGATQTGVFQGVGGGSTAGTSGFLVTASFVPRLAHPPAGLGLVTEGGAPTEDCPGSAAEPAAAPGFLCFYETNVSDAGAVLTVGDADPTLGFGLAYTTDADTIGLVEGTWAVTPPATAPAPGALSRSSPLPGLDQ